MFFLERVRNQVGAKRASATRWQSRAKPIMDRAENIPGLRIDDWPVICVRLRKQAYTWFRQRWNWICVRDL